MRAIDLLGTSLTATSYDEFAQYCRDLVAGGKTWAVDLTNTHVLTKRRHDPEFREITSKFDFFLPDGMPIIWCLNRKGAELGDRVYGPTFMRHFVLNTPAPYRHYLLGGSAECLARLTKRLSGQQSALEIVGSHHGYFKPDEEERILEEINSLSPDFIWIGLGTPKQQEWIHRYKSRINRGILFAVGFAFDVNAGTKLDAPFWMQRLGLTWLFRALTEPRRLLGRYIRYNTLFLYYLCKDALARATTRRTPASNSDRRR